MTICARRISSHRGIIGLLVLLSACADTDAHISHKEDQLAAAGFAYRPANNDARQAMLNRLPSHHFVRRLKGGQTFYIYADPEVCNCLYIGDQAAYSRYTGNAHGPAPSYAPDDAPADYHDTQWNWHSWGPWNGGWGGLPGGAYGGWNPAWGNWDPGMGPTGW